MRGIRAVGHKSRLASILALAAGLGLAVARSLVEAHDGTIGLAEAPGGGTRVRIGLPVFRPEA